MSSTTFQNQQHNQSFRSDHSHNTQQNASSASLNQSFQTYQKSQALTFPLTISQNLAFSNQHQDFVLSLEATDERVTIMVEDRFDINCWRGDFTSKYIEEITKKTGKERTYATFMQMLIGTIQNASGFSQFYIDLMGFQDLQLLKAKRGGEDMASNNSLVKNNKKYMILTHLMNGQKVHYPLPLNPVETGTYLMDKETMKRMVKRMSQTLTEFKNMNVTGGSSNMGSVNQSNGFSINQQQNAFGRQTAKEFFSKENLMHPAVEENATLKKKLQHLEQAKQMGGAVSLNTLHAEKQKVQQDFQSYQIIIQKEIKKLKTLKQELQKRINDTRVEIQSERPQSAYSQLSMNGVDHLANQTMTSNFGGNQQNSSLMGNEIEDLRRQLSEVSVELEETKDQYHKKLAFQQKDMEEYYDQLSSFRVEEKQMRVKVNQLEVELEHQLKRLDIICKSKGLPRPQRRSSSNISGSGSNAKSRTNYVSPYRMGPGSNNGSQTRNLSNGSGAKKPSPYRNFNYTPPNRRNQSPANLSNGSGTGNPKYRGSSPLGTTNYSNNSASLRNRQQQQQSPGTRSNASSGSKTGATTGAKSTQNRLYSPSGRIRTTNTTTANQGSNNLYGSSGVANRVRREPAVGGGGSGTGSRSNSRTRAVNSSASNNDSAQKRQSSNSGIRSQGNNAANARTYGTGGSQQVQRKYSQGISGSTAGNSQTNNRKTSLLNTGSNSQIKSSQQTQKTTSLFTGGNNRTTSILDQQKAAGSIDEKIEKLQSIIRQAKTNQ